MLKAEPIPKLWSERIVEKTRLPRWIAGFVVFVLPFVILDPAVGYALGIWEPFFLKVELPQYSFNVPFLLLCYYASSYFRARTSALKEHCVAMGVTGDARLDLSGMGKSSRIAVLFIVLFSTFIPIYVMYGVGDFTFVQRVLAASIPYSYFLLVLATFVWAYGYSMYSIFKMGRLPLKLKAHTEDSMLGLRPFGAASLRLTAVFLTFIFFGVLPASISPDLYGLTSAGAEIFLGALVIVMAVCSLGLFFLPLTSLRRQLLHARRTELAWIAPIRTDLLTKMRSSGPAGPEKDVLDEYNSLGGVERDARQIHTWPFDVNLFARLLAIILSVSAIILSRLVANFLKI